MSTDNVKWFEIPKPKNGLNATIFYDEESLPEGFTIEEISSRKDKIPYVEGKGNPPHAFYPEHDIRNLHS